MATTVREFSLDYYLHDRIKYSGLDKENLTDLVNIIISLKNKYRIVPYALAAHGQPIPTGSVVSYLIDSLGMNKMRGVPMDTPRQRHYRPARHPALAPLRAPANPRRLTHVSRNTRRTIDAL